MVTSGADSPSARSRASASSPKIDQRRPHTKSGSDGRKLVRPGFPQLKAIAFTGDYEGYVSLAFGLADHAAYRIQRLQDPKRIVIDFHH